MKVQEEVKLVRRGVEVSVDQILLDEKTRNEVWFRCGI